MTGFNVSDTQIANMALSRIGSTQVIQSLNPAVDQSNETAQLNLWYYADRDAELTDWPWSWATKYVTLDQVSTTGIPANPEWIYSYRYPSDCLSVRRLVVGQIVTNAQISQPPPTTAPPQQVFTTLAPFRQDGDPYPYPFEIGQDETGRLLYTDCPNAWCRYTFQQQDPTQFSRDFVDMLAWRVAADCYGLSRSDARRDYCQREYERSKQKARSRDLNEAQNSQPFIQYNSESIRARQIG